MLYGRQMNRTGAMAAENRSEGRSNVFITATLDCGAGLLPVRIRNISPKGALIDGSSLPAVGTRVRLQRGRLAEAGELAWAGKGQCGVTFDREIDVPSWVRRVGHAGQRRVDQVVAALRNSDATAAELEDDTHPDSLAAISAALDELCERLAKTPGVAADFGDELLSLDTIAQSLRRLATGRPY
jgi:hypothetical protein